MTRAFGPDAAQDSKAPADILKDFYFTMITYGFDGIIRPLLTASPAGHFVPVLKIFQIGICPPPFKRCVECSLAFYAALHNLTHTLSSFSLFPHSAPPSPELLAHRRFVSDQNETLAN